MKWIIIVSKKNNVSDVLGNVSDVLLRFQQLTNQYNTK